MREIEHKLDLILWAMDLKQLPDIPVTRELKQLQAVSTSRLIRNQRELDILNEYETLKDRMKIIEEDYPHLVK